MNTSTISKPPHHDKLHLLSIEIVNASLEDDSETFWEAYNQIKEICEAHEGSNLDHPFQWETLADFTSTHNEAMPFYFKALNLARELELVEYVATINLAIAEQYFNFDDLSKAWNYACAADIVAIDLEDLGLKKEISEMLLKLGEYIK